MILIRYCFKIIRLLILYRLDQEFLPKCLAISRLLPKRDRANAPERLKMLFEHLGPLWVKFGQILSTRYDVFPEKWLKALAQLQDAVKPFSDAEANSILQQQIPDFFDKFELQAGVLASASIAQVYVARHIQDQQEVVVKVLRPGIKKAIRRDIKCLNIIASIGAFLLKDSRRLHLLEVVQELEYSLNQEINFLAEAANAATFARNFADDSRLIVPKIYWDYSTEKVLIMERIRGIPMIDVMQDQTLDKPYLAKLGIELFFTQVLRDSFFHADMHPGNIFVEGNIFQLVDFGIVGSLSTLDRRYIAENMLAFFKRDYRRVAVLHVKSGWVPADTRVDHFEAAIRQVCEPIFARPLKDISFGQLFLQLIKTARAFRTEIQPQLILLQKTLLQIEAVGRMLDPNLDLWATVQPQLEQWLNRQAGWSGFKDKVKANFPGMLEQAPEVPELLLSYLQQPKQLPVVTQANTFWPFICGCLFTLVIVFGILCLD